jgi:hypothetical protein
VGWESLAERRESRMAEREIREGRGRRWEGRRKKKEDDGEC